MQLTDFPEAKVGRKKEVRQVKKFVFALFMVAFALAAAPHAMATPVPAPEGGENLPYLIMAGASCFGAMVYRIRGFRKK